MLHITRELTLISSLALFTPYVHNLSVTRGNMTSSARLYHCARCHRQAIICSRCDRGQIYCNRGCAQQARTLRQRLANAKYRNSPKGQRANALRQRRFRERARMRITKKVTHQGSQPSAPNDLIPRIPQEGHYGTRKTRDPQHFDMVCHFCLHRCHPFLRPGFFKRRGT